MSLQVGKGMIVIGALLLIVGLLLTAGVNLSWLRPGRLPGDVVWTNASGSFRIYFPLATSLLLSLLLTLLFKLFRN